jgi:hypothetical protein
MLAPVAVHASVAVPREEKGVGDLAAESAGNVNEADQTDDGGTGKFHPRTSNDVGVVRLHDFSLALDDQTQSSPHRYHGERLEGCVERKTAHVTLPVWWKDRNT